MARRSTLLAAALAAIVGVGAPAAHAAAAPFKLDIHFSKTPAKFSNQATPSFSLTRNVHFGVKSQTCRIGTGAWKACSMLWKPGHLADGRHTAQAKLVMNDGRTAGASYTWTIDTAVPNVQAPQNLQEWTVHIAIPLAAGTDTGSGIASQQWRYGNGGGWSQWFNRSAQANATAPSNGTWNFQYRVIDHAGNQKVVSFAQGQDSTPPPMPYIYRGSAQMTVTVPTFLGVGQIGDDQESHLNGRWDYEISTDGGTTWSDPVEYDDEITFNDPGTYTMRARSQNNAGLWSDWTTPDANATVNFDPPRPAAPVITGGHGSDPDDATDVAFYWQPAVDPLDPDFTAEYQIQERLDGGAWQDIFTSPYTSMGVSGGGCLLVEVRVRASGSSGYWSDWSAVTDASTDRLCGAG